MTSPAGDDLGLLPDSTKSPVGGGGFFVQTDPSAEALRVEDRLSPHAGMVASTAAGAGFFDGAFDGVAPAAQLLSVGVTGSWHHSEIEGLITAFQDRRTDVVQLAMGGASLVNDGHEVLDIITDRLIATYGKLATVSAMNLGPGMGTTGSPSVASQAVSVSAAMPRATWRANFGVPVAAPITLMPSSSRGPRGDGALKPDLVAPTGGFAAGVAGKADAFGLNLTYRPPAGYLIGGGTSQAAPFVAGAIALLISGARQSHLPYDPPRLKRALLAGAHPLAGYQAYEQGNGLLDVRRAWAALQRMRQTPPSTIVTCAPVHTVVSRDMVAPNAGAGLYEREGWRAGQQGTRIVTFRRLDGPTDPVSYRVRWVGNDGTFASASAVTLPRGASVEFPVHIGPVTPGVHSARLDLVDPRDGLMAHQMLATVVATAPFTGRNGHTVVQIGQVPRPGSRSLFFAVPPGVPAVRFALTLQSGAVQPRFYPPAPNTAFVTGGRIANYQQATQGHPVSWSQTFAHPAPGVWEMVLVNSSDLLRRDSTAPVPLPPAEFRVTASLLGVRVGGETDSGLVVTNPYARGPVEARVVWGSVYRQDFTMRQGVAPFIHTLTVPAEATALAVMTDHPSDSAADLTLAVFECPAADRCVLRGVSLEAGGVHRVTVPRPRAGTWKVVVSPVHLTGEMIQVRYREAYFQPPPMDSLLTRPSLRRAGDHWVMVLGQRLAPRPDTVPGRTIEPVVQVTSPAARRLDRVDDPDLSKRYDPFQVPPAGWSEVPLGEWWYGEGAAPR